MGYFSEYLERRLTSEERTKERKAQLRHIGELRGGRDVIVYAADLRKNGAPIGLMTEDVLLFEDQLANLKADKIDVILETPGGYAEVVEDMVRLLRGKYTDVGFIVPGTAKSAGTIMAMSGDEILMGPSSSLGPIDAQMKWHGSTFSAEAFLLGIEKIKEETRASGCLNLAFVPILQKISPGDIEEAGNALEFARELVRRWLAAYKFGKWATHSSTGQPVTDEDRVQRANEIATQLCAHSHWLSHGRSIKIDDLEKMGLRITDYSKEPLLAEAIGRYYSLLHLTFEESTFKIIETPTTQIYRKEQPRERQGPPLPVSVPDAGSAVLETVCPRCGTLHRIQANLVKGLPIEPGHQRFPMNNKFRCGKCGNQADLEPLRAEIERKLGGKVVE